MLSALTEILESSNLGTIQDDEVLGFPEYLDLVKREPWTTRNTFQLLHDMLLSSGVERTIVPGKPIKHRYAFFEDDALVGTFVVFGQQKAKENLLEKIDNASRGLEASKRLWILLGPPGAAKSRSMDGIKTALNVYSRSDEGKTYTLLLPTVDERLREKALFEEKGVYYLQSPIFERPLQDRSPRRSAPRSSKNSRSSWSGIGCRTSSSAIPTMTGTSASASMGSSRPLPTSSSRSSCTKRRSTSPGCSLI